MNKVNVIDASAILAYLKEENGKDIVGAALNTESSWTTSVNYCEVLGKLCEHGMTILESQATVSDLRMTVIDFNAELARRTADLRVRTKSIGASLGDRACLSLAFQAAETASEIVVYTAERTWTKLKWPFKIELIRSGRVTG